jgi:hypothetical protein
VPVYIKVGDGFKVSGLQFRAAILAEGATPALNLPAQFVADASKPASIIVQGGDAGMPLNQVSSGWPLVPSPAFVPALQKTNLLGYIQFTVPAIAQAGQTYSVHFVNVDGSPNLETQYDFESFPGTVWVGTAAQKAPEAISDEWKIHFFGSASSPLAAASADPDRDGVSNLDEYLAQSNPADLHLEVGDAKDAVNGVAFKLRWLSIPGQRYLVQESNDLSHWTSLGGSLSGTGDFEEFSTNPGTSGARFYRVIGQP